MKENTGIKNMVFQIIENQINENNPPETKLTLDRLIREGHSELNAKKLIGQCLLIELNKVMKSNDKFDNKRYVENLSKLPKEPIG